VTALVHREAGPVDGPPALLVHGFPESSYMWRELLEALGGAGYRAVAPDLAGFGDSPADRPGTWERHVEALEEFRQAQELDDVVLVVHDWGGLIGLRWACDHPGAARALVICDTGFFADGRWHGMGEALRGEGGDDVMASMTPALMGQALGQLAPGMDEHALAEYTKCLDDDDRRAAILDLYRSGDFEKLEPYAGCLAALDLPTLLLWGAGDELSPVAAAERLQAELPRADLVVIDGAGHFVWDDAGETAAAAVLAFLASEQQS